MEDHTHFNINGIDGATGVLEYKACTECYAIGILIEDSYEWSLAPELAKLCRHKSATPAYIKMLCPSGALYYSCPHCNLYLYDGFYSDEHREELKMMLEC